MLDEQEGNFARCLQLQLSELRWKRVAEFVPRLVYRRMLSAAALTLFLRLRSPLETAGSPVELQQGASAHKDTSKNHQPWCFGLVHEQSAVF